MANQKIFTLKIRTKLSLETEVFPSDTDKGTKNLNKIIMSNKTFKVEFWRNPYQGAKSELVRVEDWIDNEDSFKKFYHENNSLKYCNGTHYLISDSEVRARYSEFLKTYNTISNYYNGGIVD